MVNMYVGYMLLMTLLNAGEEKIFNELKKDYVLIEEDMLQFKEQLKAIQHHSNEEEIEDLHAQKVEELEDVLSHIQQLFNSTSQIEILDLQYDYPNVMMNLSEELVVYGGGNTAEYQVIQYLLDWGFEEVDVEQVEIYIEGRNDLFPEGSLTEPCSRESYELYYSREE